MPTPDPLQPVPGTFELRPFAAPEAERIAGWAATPEDVWHAAAVLQFPLAASDVTRWTMETNFAFTLRVEGDLAAYAEIVEDEVEGDVEIQHLLVAPDLRGRGIGRMMLARMGAFLAAARPYPEVWMRVGQENAPGLRCAAAAGFEAIDALSGPQYVWLKKLISP